MLEIKNLHAGIKGKAILDGLNLKVNPGELHAIMGRNGSGKSTLALAMMGYVKQGLFTMDGECIFNSSNLLTMDNRELEKIRGRKIAMIPQNAGQSLTPNLKLGYQIDEALKHPNVKLIANALGTPPADMIKKIQDKGVLIGALCGKIKQAVAHKEAGLDFIIAQGGEGGGHTGEIGSIVLWPQIIDAVDGLPVLAAGGIGSGRQMAAAMSTGAQGVWCGSLWLAVEEAAAQPAEKDSYLNATSEDTIRSKAWTGKPARMLKNKWTEAWENPENPDPLPMPLQGMITFDAMRRTSMYAGSGSTQDVSFNAAGQVIGQVKQIESVKDVIYRIINEYLDSVDRLNSLLPKE